LIFRAIILRTYIDVCISNLLHNIIFLYSLLHVSALNTGHPEGATSRFDVFGNLLKYTICPYVVSTYIQVSICNLPEMLCTSIKLTVPWWWPRFKTETCSSEYNYIEFCSMLLICMRTMKLAFKYISKMLSNLSENTLSFS
jgi:hypothetical protein